MAGHDIISVRARQVSLSDQAIASALHQQLITWKFRLSAPIWDILQFPHNLVLCYRNPEPILLNKIMENIYHYGRNHWTWTATGTADNRRAYYPEVDEFISNLAFMVKLRWQRGRGLLDGATVSGACGDFAGVFQFISKYLFNLNVKFGDGTSATMIGGHFITMPHTEVIDKQWRGNVWADNADNKQIQAFYFYGHYFCNAGGRIYDVTCNKSFSSINEMIWCRLAEVDYTELQKFGGARSVFNITQVNKTNIIVRQRGVNIGNEKLQVGAGGFSNLLMTDRTELAPLEIRRFAQRSSRI